MVTLKDKKPSIYEYGKFNTVSLKRTGTGNKLPDLEYLHWRLNDQDVKLHTVVKKRNSVICYYVHMERKGGSWKQEAAPLLARRSALGLGEDETRWLDLSTNG